MKKLYSLLLLLPFLSCRHATSPATERKLQSLLDQKEYFRLRDEMTLHPEEVSPEKSLYFSAFIDNVFNRNAASAEKVQSLLEADRKDLSDSVKALLLQLEVDDYFKTYQYAKAAAVDNELVAHYRNAMDSASYADEKNSAIITNALVKTPPQEFHLMHDDTIPRTRDKVGLMQVQFRHGDSVYPAIFDTRASISSISVSYAKRIGVRMLDVTYDEGSSITGQRFKSQLGVADSFRVNNILMRNVVFQVMPDEVLYIAQIDLSLPIIIGYPVIEQWGEVHILQNGMITVPIQPHPSDLHNLALDGLNPVIQAFVDSDMLGFKFDTGATTSDIFDNYFRLHKEDIMRRGKTSTIRLGGAGGVVSKEVYTLQNFKIRVGSKTATLKEVAVHKDPIPNVNEKFYGNLGQDVMGQFKETIINFKDMYVDLKN